MIPALLAPALRTPKQNGISTADLTSPSGIGLADCVYYLRGAVPAVVVHYDHFIRNYKRIQTATNSLQNSLNVARLM
ncbi:MAG: hypothetical protein WAM78_09395 [Candidatus Sulfotelmatobacter sp.]